jgi:hypothetical protein
MATVTDAERSGVERHAQWATWDDSSTETVFERFENGGWVVEGIVSGLDAQYVVRLGPAWEPRQLLVFRDQDEPDLWLATDGAGTWGEVNGSVRDELQGCTDVHVAGTVYPTVLPMRRLDAQHAVAGDVRTIVVDTETLSVRSAVHRYERVAERRWRLGHGTELTVDEVGFPLDVEGVWRRLA